MMQHDSNKMPLLARLLVGLLAISSIALLVLAVIRPGPDASPAPVWVTFLGRFHPVALHLPIGGIVMLGVYELWAWLFKQSPAALVVVLFAAAAAHVTALLGLLLAWNGEYDPSLLRFHQWLALTATVLATVVLAQRIRVACAGSLPLYRGLVFLTMAVIGAAGHFGGSMTHGKDFLTELADEAWPSFKRSLTAEEPRAAEPSVTDLYADVVQPIFRARCHTCHSASKMKGGLNLETRSTMIAGGKTGPALVPGDIAKSNLLTRISLPPEDKRHMPPVGKPQLSPEEQHLLQWWIEQGAPEEAPLANLVVPKNLQNAIASLAQHSFDTVEHPLEIEEDIAAPNTPPPPAPEKPVGTTPPSSLTFEADIVPFLKTYCYDCHGSDLPMGDMDLTALVDVVDANAQSRTAWEKALHQLKAGNMPPEGMAMPSDEQRQNVLAWIETQLQSLKQ